MESVLNKRIVARDGMVTVADLAEAIGIDRSGMHRHLKKLSVAIAKRRSVEARGQFVSVVSREDAEQVIRGRLAETLGGMGQVQFVEVALAN